MHSRSHELAVSLTSAAQDLEIDWRQCRSLLVHNLGQTAEKGKSFPWHQDAGYGDGPKDYLIFWAAFDDADQTNGCLWVIPGSHVEGIAEHEYQKCNEHSYAGVFLKTPHPRQNEMRPLCVQRGDLICIF